MSKKLVKIDGEWVWADRREARQALARPTEAVSDTLGVADHQLAEAEADARSNGFGEVVFKEDPTCEGWYQATCKDPKVWDSYVQHRGYVNKTGSTQGSPLSKEQYTAAVDAVMAQYGPAEKT